MMRCLALLLVVGCAADPPVVTTTPAEITITTAGVEAHQTVRGHSAYAIAAETGLTVVFTDARVGTDCKQIDGFTARWTVAGADVSHGTWLLEMPDGEGSLGTLASSSSFELDLTESNMAGRFESEPAIRDNQQVTVSGVFDAPWCDGQWPAQ